MELSDFGEEVRHRYLVLTGDTTEIAVGTFAAMLGFWMKGTNYIVVLVFTIADQVLVAMLFEDFYLEFGLIGLNIVYAMYDD